MTTADVRITANASQANRELEGFAAKVATMSGVVRTSMSGIGTAVGGLQGKLIALTGVVSGGFLAAGVKAQIDMMDASRKAAAAAGLQVQTFSELAYTAGLSGVESETLGKAMGKINDQMVKVAANDPALKKLFEQTLKVAVLDSNGALRASDEVLADVAERFAALEDGPRKTALAIQIFGERMGPKLIPFLNSGRQGIEQLREEFRRLHGVMTDEQTKAAEDFNDNMSRLGVAANGLKVQIANSILPVLVDFSSFAVQAAKDVGILHAAWLTFGRVADRIWNGDQLTQAQKNLARTTGHTALLKKEMAELERHLERNPKNQGLADEMERLRKRLEEVQKKAEAAKKEVADLQAGSKEPASQPDRRGEKERYRALMTEGISGAALSAGPDTRMQQWEADLARRRAAFAKSQQEIGSLRELGKEEEAEYWKKILDSLRTGDAQRTAVELKYYALQGELRRQNYEADQAARQVEIDAARGNFAQQEALTQKYVDRARDRFGAESKEYQAALKFQQGIKRGHDEAMRQLEAMRLQEVQAVRLDEVDAEQRQADLRFQLGQITAERLLEIRAEGIERRRQIEEEAKQAEIAAMQGNPASDPVALEKLQMELEAIRRRYKGLAADNQGQQQAQKQSTEMEPFNAIFGVSQSAVEQGLQSMVMNMTVTLEGLRNVFRQIGGVMVQELITKPLATWIVGQGRMVALTWAFGQQKATAEATTAAQITAIQAAASLKVIAMKAYEAAAGAYSAIAGIPYVGPILAPIAAGVALAGVFAFAKSIFSAEGGFDIPKGVNPLVQAHSNEMVLPSKHADTIRTLGDMFQSGQGMPAGGSTNVQIEGMRLDGGYLITTEDSLIKALKKAHRNYRF